jgi:uncharacterized membrane protein YdjX (TVP38/TMEM64 family)
VERARLRLVVFAALLLGFFLVAAVSGSLPRAADIRDWGDEAGWAGAVAFIPAATVLLCLLVPGPVLAGGAGLLFGTAAGTPIALAVMVLGAVSQMSITRYLAADPAAQLLPERVKRFDRFLSERGFWAVFYMRLAPAIPYSLVNYGAGLTSLRTRAMAAGTAVGALPRTFAWVALGGSLDDLGSPEARIAIALLVVMAAIGAFLARRELVSERSA